MNFDNIDSTYNFDYISTNSYIIQIYEGIPATLNYISLDANRGGSPKLTPYPNWAQNKAGACGSGLTTVYR